MRYKLTFVRILLGLVFVNISKAEDVKCALCLGVEDETCMSRLDNFLRFIPRIEHRAILQSIVGFEECKSLDEEECDTVLEQKYLELNPSDRLFLAKVSCERGVLGEAILTNALLKEQESTMSNMFRLPPWIDRLLPWPEQRIHHTAIPTLSPTAVPTMTPTEKPTHAPTAKPTSSPTDAPTQSPTLNPTKTPTVAPSQSPTFSPSFAPTVAPTFVPTMKPTLVPTLMPTLTPTSTPTSTPTATPTSTPTATPTSTPTLTPTSTPTLTPTLSPTLNPTTLIVEEYSLSYSYSYSFTDELTWNVELNVEELVDQVMNLDYKKLQSEEDSVQQSFMKWLSHSGNKNSDLRKSSKERSHPGKILGINSGNTDALMDFEAFIFQPEHESFRESSGHQSFTFPLIFISAGIVGVVVMKRRHTMQRRQGYARIPTNRETSQESAQV